MYCIKVDMPELICDIDDELKAIYHSKDTVCIWFLKPKLIKTGLLMKLLRC